MLPLPDFEWLAPKSLDELVRALGERPDETRLLAGGTDLLPNLKHGLHAPKRVIGLRGVRELAQIDDTADGSLTIGAGVSLDRVAHDPRILARYPALARAASRVASPQIRHMGTLGGNLCLDTRCRYFNQTAFWRGALGGCLKKEGEVCHVVPQGKRCVAAFSADTPGPLITYDATLDLVSVRGSQTLPVAKFFGGDGLKNQVRASDEVLTRVHLPAPAAGLRSAYEKVRAREAIDFPLLSVAAAVVLDEGGLVTDVRVVVGALGALPRAVGKLDSVKGKPLSAETIDAIAQAAHAQCHPLASLGAEGWRQDVVAPTVRRALGALTPSARG
jgi:4-hydroxybenzoyl-CoA reductase subunit beta